MYGQLIILVGTASFMVTTVMVDVQPEPKPVAPTTIRQIINYHEYTTKMTQVCRSMQPEKFKGITNMLGQDAHALDPRDCEAV